MEDRTLGAVPAVTTEADDTPFAGLPSRLVRASSWEPRPVPTLVTGLLHRTGLAQFASKPGVGKSPVAADLAVAVANADANGGTTWAGLAINRRGPAVYVALESAETVHGYIAEASAVRGVAPAVGCRDVWVIEEPELALASPSAALDSLERIGHDVDEAGVAPVLFVFDTQVDMLGGIDDYKGTSVTPLIDKLRRWCVERGALGLVLHHTTHSADRGSGSINVMGKVDTAAVLVKDKEGVVTMRADKRNGLGPPITVASLTFESGGVAGNAAVRWVRTGADAAGLAASVDGASSVAKDRLTEEWLLRLMPETGNLDAGTDKKPAELTWSNRSAALAMEALTERPRSDGGPVAVHRRRGTVDELLDRLADQGLIEDRNTQWKSGQPHRWVRTGPPPE